MTLANALLGVSPLLSRGRLTRLARFASAQAAIQVIGFAAGIVLIRSMSTMQYGHYVMALSMTGLANVLLDLGLATAVLARGGVLHDQSARLAGLVGDAFSLQTRMALVAVMLMGPAFAAVLLWQGLPAREAAALTLMVIACTVLSARAAVTLSVVRLRNGLGFQQRLELAVNLGKLLVVVAVTALLVNAEIAMAVNVAAAVAMFWTLDRYLGRHLGRDLPAVGEHRDALLRFIRQQAPNSIYYCVSGQIAIWLVSVVGSATRVAEVGALSRLALLFTIVGAVVTAFAQPYFARAVRRRDLARGLYTLNACFLSLSAGLVLAAATYPNAMLWILGPQYAVLTSELPWMVLSASLAAWSGANYSVGAARGWVIPAPLVIFTGLATMAVAAWLLDLSTVRGAVLLNVATSAVALAITLGFVAMQVGSGRRRAAVA